MGKRIPLSDQRKYYFIKDVVVPNEFKEENDLINLIYDNFHEENYDHVFNSCVNFINKYKYSENFVCNIIGTALENRLKNLKNYRKLLNAFVNHYQICQHHYAHSILHASMPVPNSLNTCLMNDEIDKFQEYASVPNFNFDGPITDDLIKISVSILEYCAMYGSIKCFKYALLNDAIKDETDVPYVILGGNFEICHYYQDDESIFSQQSYVTAIKCHRNDIADWILCHNRCYFIETKICLEYFNYEAFFFWNGNGISSTIIYDFSSYLSNSVSIVGSLAFAKKINPEYFSESFLIEYNALNIIDLINHCKKFNFEKTAIINCIYNDKYDIFSYALDNLPPETAEKYLDCSLILDICQKGRFRFAKKVFDEFIDANADLNLYPKVKPILIACQGGSVKTVDYLLSKGASIFTKDENGHDCVYYAKLQRDNAEILAFLRSKGLNTN